MSQGVSNGNAASLGGSGQTSQLLYSDGTVAIGTGEIGGSGPLHTGVTVYDDTGAIQFQVSGVLGCYFPMGLHSSAINCDGGFTAGSNNFTVDNSGTVAAILFNCETVNTTNFRLVNANNPFGEDSIGIVTVADLVAKMVDMGILS